MYLINSRAKRDGTVRVISRALDPCECFGGRVFYTIGVLISEVFEC